MLYIVSTPIGNLKDITLRAIETLKEADLILAEDTRRTSILLKEYVISKPMYSFSDLNKESRTKYALELLKQDKKIALVSDAGTPGISDPGFYLVRAAVKEGILVSPIPGACALIAGLVCSGLPTDKFEFYGFIPKKEGQKKKFFLSLGERTAVFYESPHRILKTLKVMNEIMPLRQVVIARELTKKFEEFIRGTVSEVYEKMKDRIVKGEMVVIIH